LPLTRISLRRGKPAAYKLALMTALYQAMRETFDVPDEDRFIAITEHDQDTLWFSPNYLGIDRSDNFVMIQITVSNTRTAEKKKALYRRIVELLATSPGVRPEDVLINLVEVTKENWSFGEGEAQYA
jgi:phenylpyruvate tautomerase PptA (4-oxalocrotonate tautomerase family)